MSKYHSVKMVVDGIEFHSKKEAKRYRQLKLMEKAGTIRNLTRQVKYELIPAQYIDGKCVERAVTYTSDFEYDEVIPIRPSARIFSRHIVEDVKGLRTDVYTIKRKMMLFKYGIQIHEI